MLRCRDQAGGREYLIAQTTFQEGWDLHSVPSKRSLLLPHQWLLIHDLSDDSMTWFDLATDPSGTVQSEGPEPELAAELVQKLRSHDVKGSGETAEGERPRPNLLSKELQEELRALGYIE